MTLYAEQGFERTTAAQIAQLAGLTERTFFRNFADKREVLFYGVPAAQELLTRAVTDAPDSATPMDAVSAAIEAMCAMFQENPERVRQREAVISANPELQERNLTKHSELAAAMARALLDRGVPDPAASLTAETGIAVYRVAFARWIKEPGEPDLPGIFRNAMAKLRGELADHAPA
ncbi:MAG: TetR/AcrR family transcriptional regulator [Streptosporangiaceae bacterium]